MLAHGVDAQFFGRVEATFDQFQVPFVATDGLSLLELKIEPSLEFHKSKERRGSASLQTEIQGYQTGKWSARCYLRTNGAGVAPPMDVLLRMLVGQAPTIVGGTSVRYTLANAILTGQLARYVPTNLYEQINGAWVEELGIENVGNQEPVLTFSGGYARYGWLFGGAMTTATVTAGATTFTLDAASIGKLGPNVRIAIGTDNAAGVGYNVTSVDHSTGQVVFTGALGVTQTGATAITIVAPTPTYTGTIRGGINSRFSIGGTFMGLISGKTTIKTGLHGLLKQVTSDRASRVARGDREVTLSLEAYFLDEEAARHQGRAWAGVTNAVVQRVGQAAAGAGVDVETPAVRFNVAPIELPEAEEAILKLDGMARLSAASNDEIALMFN